LKALGLALAWTAEAAVTTWSVDEEILIVDFGLLIENLSAPRFGG
jgi:hypothetical protein